MSSASRASRPFAAAALVAAAAFLPGGCADSGDPAEPRSSARKASPAATSAPASASAGPRRPPQRIDASAAAEGSIEIEDGPFTDRVKASDLELRGSRRPRISGRLLNLTDVSEVLLLELQADFYDRRGRYLGSGKQTFEEAEAFSETALRFDIAGGSQPRPASAAILTVPALVNE